MQLMEEDLHPERKTKTLRTTQHYEQICKTKCINIGMSVCQGKKCWKRPHERKKNLGKRKWSEGCLAHRISKHQELGGDLEAQGRLSPVRPSDHLFWGMLREKRKFMITQAWEFSPLSGIHNADTGQSASTITPLQTRDSQTWGCVRTTWSAY